MVDISRVFEGATLKAADLQGQEHTVVIATVKVKEFDNGNKLVITFQERKKALVANKTNSNRIAKLYGTNTDNWIGKEIVLYPDTVDFQGDQVDAIRVRGPVKQQPQQAPQQVAPRQQFEAEDRGRYDVMQRAELKRAEPAQVQGGGGLPDDEIPFALEWR